MQFVSLIEKKCCKKVALLSFKKYIYFFVSLSLFLYRPMKMQFWGGKHFLKVEKNISFDLKLSTVANILYSSIGYYYYWKTHKKFKRSKLKKIIGDWAKKKEFLLFCCRNNNLFKFNKSLKEKTHLVSQWAKNLLKSANASSVQSYLSAPSLAFWNLGGGY